MTEFINTFLLLFINKEVKDNITNNLHPQIMSNLQKAYQSATNLEKPRVPSLVCGVFDSNSVMRRAGFSISHSSYTRGRKRALEHGLGTFVEPQKRRKINDATREHVGHSFWIIQSQQLTKQYALTKRPCHA